MGKYRVKQNQIIKLKIASIEINLPKEKKKKEETKGVTTVKKKEKDPYFFK